MSMGRADAARPAARLTAIGSGKGGVGKTCLSIGLAHALARRGQRVLIFDGDLGMANIDVQLGLVPRADLGAVVSGRTALQDAASPALGGAGQGGFDVIAGRSGSGALAGLAAEETARLAAGLAALSLAYDHVLIDLAAGADPSLLRLAGAADDVAVVVTDEPTAITDAYAFVKRLRMRDEGAAPRVLVNMAASHDQARRVFEGFAKTCRAFLDFDPALLGAVRRDPAVREAVRRQRALLDHAPGAPAAQDLTRLSQALNGEALVKVA